MHLDFLRHAQKAKLRNLHSALVHLVPDPKRLLPLIDEHSDKAALHLFEYMVFKRVGYTSAMQQVLQDVLPVDADPLTQVLQQARYYAKYRMLKDNNLFLDDENDKFIAGCAIESDLLQKLHGQALHQLPILTDL